MAITCWPHGTSHDAVVLCVICEQYIAPIYASAGRCDKNGRQAFTCNSHLQNHAQYIVGWVDFAIAEHAGHAAEEFGHFNEVGYESYIH
jgi:hypothetical protein